MMRKKPPRRLPASCSPSFRTITSTDPPLSTHRHRGGSAEGPRAFTEISNEPSSSLTWSRIVSHYFFFSSIALFCLPLSLSFSSSSV
ncbi:hypothetical protein BDV59DRAFT_185496 [Aspergillus ambiguus]|uniref:uncharacterized protein n=1 Tax=Aspergillus ambiguus TaxID=176160 RepID=UPI003CCD7940